MNYRQNFVRDGVNRWLAPALTLVLMFAIAGTLTQAQGDPSRKLIAGQTINGTLNAQAYTQVYTFDGQANTNISVVANSQAAALRLAVVITDATGQNVAEASNLQASEVALRNIRINTAGTYYVTVLRATGASGTTSGTFTLSYTVGQQTAATATATPARVVTLRQGLTISLSWSSIDDFNIEVRDPIGGSVFFNNLSVPSGGKLAGNVNGNCQNTVSNPTETVSWSRGDVPSGSYEVLVYYKQACAQPAAAREFTAVVNIDGRRQELAKATLKAGEEYVASFILENADQVQIVPGGANPQLLNLTPFAAKIATPTALAGRTQIESRIDRNNQADVWSFDGVAGNVVTINMNAVDGSLDPQLILLGPDANVVASNDDANQNTRDSQITSQALPKEGRYTVVATRFAKNIGGTEGKYRLTITGLNAAATPVAGNPTPVGTAVPAATAAATESGVPIGNLPTGSIQIALLWDNRADVRLLVRDPSRQVLYSDKRQIPSGANMAQLSNLNCQNLTTTPLTYAYWPLNQLPAGTYEIQVWMNNQCNEPTPPNYTLSVSVRGREVINHKDRPDANGLLYVTTFTVSAEGVATAGKGGIFTQVYKTDVGDLTTQFQAAPVIVYGRAAVGAISADQPFQVYAVQARAGDRIRVQMRATQGTLDSFLWLVDGAGAQLNVNDDVKPGQDTNSQIDQSIPADGTYYIIATRFGSVYGGTAGTFELSVNPIAR